ncbi:hypothetical protein [Caldicellulosiruptor naganoensis]|uniref:Uncharacterized protein n=1 Tax=Caldicellulosiruptor naganoensis TaxID=29324 RepID=A0ABY7BEQ6_9FIRM|nr:hypothetical protein [Caldicellulosiruptor naganoensis]WAM30581.1 hypothetical protein OTJ99_001343 [Caldicellulosiruptor naganoensis]
MLVVFFALYSILALVCVVAIVRNKCSRLAIIIPIYLECIALFAVYKQSLAIYGLGGLVAVIVLLPMLVKRMVPSEVS